MGVFQRIADIIAANLDDMTDQFGDPELMLKQAIREMEESIREVTEQTAKAMANEKTLGRELERNRQQAADWQRRASEAVDAGDDDLARRALLRKKEHEQLMAALEDQRDAAGQASGALKRQLDAMKAKLAEAKRSYATLAARKRAAEFRKRRDAQEIEGAGTFDVDADAFHKFERLKARVEQAEAEAEAMSELRRSRPATSEPVEEPADSELDVEVELAELKRRQRKS